MKTIFLFLFSTVLFISCKNNTVNTKKDDITKDAKDNQVSTQNGWSENDKNTFLERCKKMDCGDKQSKCMLEQVEKKYPNAKDANNLSDMEMKDYKIDCDRD